jgi:hypothetical protein
LACDRLIDFCGQFAIFDYPTILNNRAPQDWDCYRKNKLGVPEEINCPLCRARLNLQQQTITAEPVRLRCGRCRGVLKVWDQGGAVAVASDAPTGSPEQQQQLGKAERTFFRQYSKIFSRNFNTYLGQQLGDADTVELEEDFAASLYAHLLGGWPVAMDEKALGLLLLRLVRATLKADLVLRKQFLHTLRDAAHYLLGHGGTVLPTHLLTARLVDAEHLLYDVYYLASRESDVRAPRFDESSVNDPEIFAQFSKYQKEGSGSSKPAVFVYYRSVPVDFPVEVIAAAADSVTLKMHRFHVAAMSKWPWVLIDSPLHGNVLAAKGAEIDLEASTARFQQIAHHEMNIERRNHIRVEPGEPMAAEVEYDERDFEGRLYDISVTSAALYIRDESVDDSWIGKQLKFRVDLPVAEDKRIEVTCDAQVRRVAGQVAGDKRARKLVLKLRLGTSSEAAVAQYVSRRQSMVLQELREVLEEYEDAHAG